jgi:Dehydrogenases with different specificities (related to short-chain alcohol dehydrogenases)
MRIENCIAVISGATSGMGEAATRAIASAGGKVVLLGRNEEKGKQLEGDIGSSQAFFVKTEISDETQVQAAMEKAIKKFGHVNAVISCAGIGPAKKILPKDGIHSLELFNQVIQTNLVGTFNMIRFGCQAMTKAPAYEDGERGVIISTASFAVAGGQIGQAAYVASKGGVTAMTLPVAREMASYGIRCNTIAPGMIDTPLFDSLSEDAYNSLIKTTIFPKRLGHAEEYASLVLEIIRNTFINGTVISVDGAVRLSPR